jgi:hypothetical protein
MLAPANGAKGAKLRRDGARGKATCRYVVLEFIA